MNKSALMLIAHPDDDAIFAYELQKKFKHFNWSVICMTHTCEDERGCELIEYQRHMGTKDDNIHFLGFLDERKDNKRKYPWYNCSIPYTSLYNRISKIDIVPDLIVTHNHMGEYNHPHHILLNRLSRSIYRKQQYIFFGYGLNDPNMSLLTSDEKTKTIRAYYESQDYVIDAFVGKRETFLTTQGRLLWQQAG